MILLRARHGVSCSAWWGVASLAFRGSALFSCNEEIKARMRGLHRNGQRTQPLLTLASVHPLIYKGQSLWWEQRWEAILTWTLHRCPGPGCTAAGSTTWWRQRGDAAAGCVCCSLLSKYTFNVSLSVSLDLGWLPGGPVFKGDRSKIVEWF